MIGINGQEEQIAWSGVPPLRPIFARHESRAVCTRRFPNEQNFSVERVLFTVLICKCRKRLGIDKIT
ncbi:hypothetical protein Desku_2914 [Desulfofundulus kuznetsovii DSM 6115]|uniref:Uncharacterized protein n=1 Tax=Desulfofundulus kuznetsovii (strain DSM 6115 / VKM B-1805 / 17) TaxID=760568 RepID=A0AAU8PYN7_DESK7|nr:hypothetical protein Desku_2914 [Desulfofundulus kuznetsovii DSM 6115]